MEKNGFLTAYDTYRHLFELTNGTVGNGKKLNKEAKMRMDERERVDKELREYDLRGFKRTAQSWRSLAPYYSWRELFLVPASSGADECVLEKNLDLVNDMVTFLESINHRELRKFIGFREFAKHFVSIYKEGGFDKAYLFYLDTDMLN